MSTDESRNFGPRGPGRVFGEFWWRSLALATAGGCVIGFVVGPVFILTADVPDRTLAVAILAAVAGAFIGAAFGIFFGVLARHV